jgi:hypothetical protein
MIRRGEYFCDEEERMMLGLGREDAALIRRRVCCCDEVERILV